MKIQDVYDMEDDYHARLDRAFEVVQRLLLAVPIILLSMSEIQAADSLYVDTSGNVGIGSNTPSAPLHVTRSNDTAKLLVEETGSGGNQALLHLKKTINAPFQRYESQFGLWDFSAGFFFVINDPADAAIEMIVEKDGDMTIGGALTENSSRATKHKIEAIEPQAVLARVLNLPVSRWTYKDDDQQARHLGPMAEDFYAAFGLGATDKGLSSIDTGGVALAAIQGLKTETDGQVKRLKESLKLKGVQIEALKKEKDQQIQLLTLRLEQLEKRLLPKKMALSK